MVSFNGEKHEDDVLFCQKNVKMFIEEVLHAQGDVAVKTNVISFESKDDEKRSMHFAYPQITLHAVCRDTTTFPHECILCMIESRAVECGQDDSEIDDGSTSDVRFVLEDSSCLQQMYDAIAAGQELHPDPEDEDSEEEMFYGDADEADIGDDGQAVLDRLENRIQMPSQGEFLAMVTGGNPGNVTDESMAVEEGQFDDANN